MPNPFKKLSSLVNSVVEKYNNIYENVVWFYGKTSFAFKYGLYSVALYTLLKNKTENTSITASKIMGLLGINMLFDYIDYKVYLKKFYKAYQIMNNNDDSNLNDNNLYINSPLNLNQEASIFDLAKDMNGGLSFEQMEEIHCIQYELDHANLELKLLRNFHIELEKLDRKRNDFYTYDSGKLKVSELFTDLWKLVFPDHNVYELWEGIDNGLIDLNNPEILVNEYIVKIEVGADFNIFDHVFKQGEKVSVNLGLILIYWWSCVVEEKDIPFYILGIKYKIKDEEESSIIITEVSDDDDGDDDSKKIPTIINNMDEIIFGISNDIHQTSRLGNNKSSSVNYSRSHVNINNISNEDILILEQCDKLNKKIKNIKILEEEELRNKEDFIIDITSINIPIVNNFDMNSKNIKVTDKLEEEQVNYPRLYEDEDSDEDNREVLYSNLNTNKITIPKIITETFSLPEQYSLLKKNTNNSLKFKQNEVSEQENNSVNKVNDSTALVKKEKIKNYKETLKQQEKIVKLYLNKKQVSSEVKVISGTTGIVGTGAFIAGSTLKVVEKMTVNNGYIVANGLKDIANVGFSIVKNIFGVIGVNLPTIVMNVQPKNTVSNKLANFSLVGGIIMLGAAVVYYGLNGKKYENITINNYKEILTDTQQKIYKAIALDNEPKIKDNFLVIYLRMKNKTVKEYNIDMDESPAFVLFILREWYKKAIRLHNKQKCKAIENKKHKDDEYDKDQDKEQLNNKFLEGKKMFLLDNISKGSFNKTCARKVIPITNKRSMLMLLFNEYQKKLYNKNLLTCKYFYKSEKINYNRLNTSRTGFEYMKDELRGLNKELDELIMVDLINKGGQVVEKVNKMIDDIDIGGAA